MRRLFTHEAARKCRLPEKATSGALFGLHDPKPQAWLPHIAKNQDKLLLEIIIKPPHKPDDKMLLLECGVAQGDDIHVLDYGVYLNNSDEDSKAGEKIRAQVGKAYWDSSVPFFDYKGGHVLPEVVCFSDIPTERLKVIKTYETFWHLRNELRESAGIPLLPPKKAVALDLNFFT